MPKFKPYDHADEETTSHALESQPIASVPSRAKPYYLEQVQGPGAPRRIDLVFDEVVIGRSMEANVPIASKSISRKHLALRRDGPEYVYSDLNSSNGVFLNGIKAHSAVLREGDAIQIGDVVFVYHEGS